MMSEAILVAVSEGQTKTGLISADLTALRGEPEGVSFAMSLRERVGSSGLSKEASFANEAQVSLLNLKGATSANKSEEITDAPFGVDQRTIASHEAHAHGDLKSTAAEKRAGPLTTTIARSQDKTSAVFHGPQKDDLVAVAEAPAEDVSAASGIPHAAFVTGPIDEDSIPSIKVSDEDRSLASSAGAPVVQKETAAGGKAKEIVSASKTVKPQKMGETPTAAKSRKSVGISSAAVQKTVATTPDAGVSEAKPAVVSTTESTIAAGPSNDIVKTTVETGDVIYGSAKPSTKVTAATASRSARKEVAPEEKGSSVDTETEVTAVVEQDALPRPGTGLERAAMAAMPAINDGEGKTQNVPGPSMASSHAMAGASWGPQDIAPGAIVSSSTPVDLTPMKQSVADPSAYTTGLRNELREGDGSGVAAAQMDGVPRTLTATPTTLEVGIPNGTRGWLKVRAEMVDGGVINASVSTASSAGQEMLHRELPALTAYLQQENVAVNTVVVHSIVPAGIESRGPGTGMEDGGGGQTPQKNDGSGGQQQGFVEAASEGVDVPLSHQDLQRVGEDGALPPFTYGGGSWLSVRA